MADAQVPVQAAVPAAQALVQPPAAPANVDNPQQDPAPLQVLISFLVLLARLRWFFPDSSSPCYSTWPFVSTVFFFLRKFRVSVVLFISPQPLPQFPHVLCLFVMFLCASPHKRRVCIVLFIYLRLPYPVCTRFVCHVFVCFASQTPGLCSALISLRLPFLCTRFVYHVLCASPHRHRVCVVL